MFINPFKHVVIQKSTCYSQHIMGTYNDFIHIRINQTSKEKLLRLLRKRRKNLSDWLREAVEEYLEANS